MHILEQACAYEIAIAAHLRAHVVTTSGRDVTQVWSKEYSPRSRATFSPLSRNLEQPLREKARVSVIDRGTESHTEISYEPRASVIHQEVVSRMQS